MLLVIDVGNTETVIGLYTREDTDSVPVVEAVRVAHLAAPGPILTEVSGGVTLETVGAYAAAGPDRISVGALTHSAPVLDLGLDLIWQSDAAAPRGTNEGPTKNERPTTNEGIR